MPSRANDVLFSTASIWEVAIKTRLGDDVVYRSGRTGGWERVDQH